MTNLTKNFSTKELKLGGYLILLLSSFLYGGNIVSARFISGDIPPFTLSLFRGLLGLIVIFPLARRSLRESPKPTRKDLGIFALMGFLGITVAYGALLWAAQYSSATNISLIFATSPAITNMLLAVGWKVIPPKTRVLGIILSFLGLLVVITQGSFSHLLALHLMPSDLMLLVNVLSIAFFTIIGQGVMRKFSPLVTSTYSLLFGTIFLAPYGIWEMFHKSWYFTSTNVLVLLYMGFFVTGLAVLFNFEGINRLGSGKAAIIGNMSPIFGLLLAYIFLDERLMIYHWLGFALVFAGIGLCLWPGRQAKKGEVH